MIRTFIKMAGAGLVATAWRPSFLYTPKVKARASNSRITPVLAICCCG